MVFERKRLYGIREGFGLSEKAVGRMGWFDDSYSHMRQRVLEQVSPPKDGDVCLHVLAKRRGGSLLQYVCDMGLSYKYFYLWEQEGA